MYQPFYIIIFILLLLFFFFFFALELINVMCWEKKANKQTKFQHRHHATECLSRALHLKRRQTVTCHKNCSYR